MSNGYGRDNQPLNFSAERIARAAENLRQLFEAKRDYDRDKGGKFAPKGTGKQSGGGGDKASERKSGGDKPEKAPVNRVKKAEKVPAEVGALPGKVAEPEQGGNVGGSDQWSEYPAETADAAREAEGLLKRSKGETDEQVDQGMDRLVNEAVDRQKQHEESQASTPDTSEADADKGIDSLIDEAAKGQQDALERETPTAKEAADAKKMAEDEFLASFGHDEQAIARMTPAERKANIAAAKIVQLAREGADPFAIIGNVDPSKAGSLGLAEVAAQKKADREKKKAERVAAKFNKIQQKFAKGAEKLQERLKKKAASEDKKQLKAEEKQLNADEREAYKEDKSRDKAKAEADKAKEKEVLAMGKTEESAWNENQKRDDKAAKDRASKDKAFDRDMAKRQKGAEREIKKEEREIEKAGKQAFKKGQAIGKALGGGLGRAGGKGKKQPVAKGAGVGMPGKAQMPTPVVNREVKLSKKDANILRETIRRLTQREPNRLLDLIHGEITKRVQNSAEAPVMTYASASITAAMEKGASPVLLPKKYEVVYESGGAVRVKDVPIFAENKRKFRAGEAEIELCYDRVWLEGACFADSRKRESGYSAPMHFGHHERGSVRKRAGHFEQKCVKLCNYHGESKWVTFADLVYSSEENFEKAKKDYPYRSVEISPDRPNEINSLALLSSEAPYFQFPNLAFSAEPGEERVFVWSDNAMAEETKKTETGTAENTAVTGATAEGVQFAPPPMNPMKKPEGAPAPQAAPPAAPPAPAPAAPPPAAPVQAAAPAAPAVPGAPPALPPAPQVSPTDQKLDALINLMQTLIEALAPGGDDQPVMAQAEIPETEAPVATTTTASSASNVQVTFTSAGETTMADNTDKKPEGEAVAKLEGEIAGLKAKLAAYEKAENDAKLFSVLLGELKGFSTSPAIETDLKAKIAESGEVAARAYVAGIKQVAPKLPPVTAPDAQPAADKASTDLPEVAKYAEKGPEALAAARRFSALFDVVKDKPAFRGKTREAYIASQFGYQV